METDQSDWRSEQYHIREGSLSTESAVARGDSREVGCDLRRG